MRRPALIVCLLALTWGAYALDSAIFGASVVSSVSEGDRTAFVLKDATGRTYTVSVKEDPTPETAAQITKLKDLFFSWQNITIGSLRFTITGTLIEALIFPERLVVGGNDLRPFAPAGLFFSYTSALDLQYDFRVTKDNLFMRVSGRYSGEEEVEQKIADAIANPTAYLQRSDAEYLLSRIDQSQTDIAGMQAALDALSKSLQSLSAQMEALRYNAMTRENVEWLFFPTPIPRAGIARILALKRDSPALTPAEAASRLKTEGIKMTDQEVRIVFKYYFEEP
ncbi:MAG: hypothetical protein ABSF77_14405 [Spirochaetia bacterium]